MNMMSKHVFNSVSDRVFHISGSFVRKDFRQSLQSFHDTHVTCMFSPANLISIVGPTFWWVFYSIIESLICCNPVDSTSNPLVFQISESDQAPNHVTCQARHHLAVPTSARLCTDRHKETTTFRILRVFQNELARLPIRSSLPSIPSSAKPNAPTDPRLWINTTVQTS